MTKTYYSKNIENKENLKYDAYGFYMHLIRYNSDLHELDIYFHVKDPKSEYYVCEINGTKTIHYRNEVLLTAVYDYPVSQNVVANDAKNIKKGDIVQTIKYFLTKLPNSSVRLLNLMPTSLFLKEEAIKSIITSLPQDPKIILDCKAVFAKKLETIQYVEQNKKETTSAVSEAKNDLRSLYESGQKSIRELRQNTNGGANK